MARHVCHSVFFGIWHCLVLILFGHLFFGGQSCILPFVLFCTAWLGLLGPSSIKKTGTTVPGLDFVWSLFFCGQSCAVPFVYLKLPASEFWGHVISEIFL